MKRLGLKIPSIVLTVISIVIFILSFPMIADMIESISRTINDEGGSGGIVVILLFFFVIAFIYAVILFGIWITSTISIVLISIDLSKTIKDKGNIAFNIVMLSINFCLYTFVTGVVIYAMCL